MNGKAILRSKNQWSRSTKLHVFVKMDQFA